VTLRYGALENFQVDRAPGIGCRPALWTGCCFGRDCDRDNLILRHYGSQPRFISHFTLIAVAITFWCAGTAPGLLRSLILLFWVSLLARNHFLLPGFSFCFSLLVGWFSASRRRAEQLLTEARDHLDLRGAETRNGLY